MELYLPKDQFDNYRPPRLFLCTTGGKRISELNYCDGKLNSKWNGYSELSFSFDRTYVDMLTGETKVHPAFAKMESLRQVEVENIGLFILQDNDDTYGERDSKALSAFSLEYALSTKYIEHFLVNKGSEDSKEVIYLSTIYGDGYSVDTKNLYKLASGDYNAYQDYYVCTIEDVDKYEQVQVQENEYSDYLAMNNSSTAQPYQKLYVKSYPNVRFFNRATPELSLLHLIMNYCPDWSIGTVDESLWRKERSFEIDRIDVYSFLTNDIADTFKCVVTFNTLNKTINFYEEADNGLTDDGQVLTRWDTDVFISRENLAEDINIKVTGDNIKTKLKVGGGDNIDISEINLGKSYIMNLDYYHNENWMEQDLIEAYDDYLEAQSIWTESYEETVQGVLEAQEKYNDALYNVAIETNVLLIGDTFKKLFCLYESIDNAYCSTTITDDTAVITDLYTVDGKFDNDAYKINKNDLRDKDTFIVQGYRLLYNETNSNFDNKGVMTLYNEGELLKKLALYHVNEDTEARTADNILLTLRHPDKHEATIRIFNTYEEYAFNNGYNEKYNYYLKSTSHNKDVYQEIQMDAEKFTEYQTQEVSLYIPHYQIKLAIANASGGTQTPSPYELSRWLGGELTAETMGLTDYTVTSIGAMGAYFVLAKDETQKANLEDYGINQLQEKYDVYLKLFLTQTQDMLSNSKNECIATDEQPSGEYLNGTRWLDTNSKPVTLMEYNNGEWTDIEVEDDEEREEATTGAANYTRYLDNYNKMIAVQEILVTKQKEIEYCRYGYSVSVTKDIFDLSDGSSLQSNMRYVALQYFNNLTEESEYTVADASMDIDLPLYTFTTSYDPIVYTPNLDAYNSDTQYYVQSSIGYIQNTLDYNASTTYYIRDDEADEYTAVVIANAEEFAEYDTLYIPNLILGTYSPIDIDTIADFNNYDGSTVEKTLYIQTGHEYAVYLRGTTPYVAYKDSVGVWQTKREYISKKTDIETYLNKNQMMRISPLIREDVYEDSNYFFTQYESREEEIKILKELLSDATKELKTLSQPSFEFSMTMANILALPEFEPIIWQFALGNFIRIELLPGVVKRSRLLECEIGLNDFSNFSATFGNLVTTRSEIDLHAELLSQAISAGKTVASAKGAYQAAMDTVNKLEQSISNGLQDVTLRVSQGSGQAISWDTTGMHFRKYKSGSTTEYEPEEMAIINNALVATNDSWRTSKAAFGKYMIDGEERWGPLAEYLTADMIEGKFIKGGAIQIGDETKEGGNLFTVDENGNVEIKSNGVEKYATKSAVTALDHAYRFRTVLVYSGLTIFTDLEHQCVVTCVVYDYENPISDEDLNTAEVTYKWTRSSNNPTSDAIWNEEHKNYSSKTITINTVDVEKNSQFYCEVNFEEDKLPVHTTDETTEEAES